MIPCVSVLRYTILGRDLAIERIPANEHFSKILESGLLSDKFPLKPTPTSDLMVRRFEAKCIQCSEPLPENCVYGRVQHRVRSVELNTGRIIEENHLLIEAIGKCERCELYSPHFCLLFPDGSTLSLPANYLKSSDFYKNVPAFNANIRLGWADVLLKWKRMAISHFSSVFRKFLA